MTFMESCPNCSASNKVVKKCKACFKLCCSECSVNGECMDCYIEKNKNMELDIYFKEKNKYDAY